MRTTLLANNAKAVTKVLVFGMAYECKDGRFAAVANECGTKIRRKDYFATWDEARNAAKNFAVELLGDRAYKPAAICRKHTYTLNLWA